MKWIAVLVFSFSIGLTPAVASSMSCKAMLSKNTSILTANDLYWIDSHPRTKNFDKEYWENLFKIYFERRISLLPEQAKISAKRKLQNLKMSFETFPKGSPSTNYLVMPAYLKDTPLPYVYLAHELEHFLRSLEKSHGQSLHAGGLITNFNPLAMYSEEAFAMKAEWELAAFINETEAQKIIELVEASSEDTRSKMVSKNMVIFRGLSKSEYLSQHRASGRYSFLNSLSKVTRRWVLTAAVPAYMGGFIYGLCEGIGYLYHLAN